MTASRTTLHHRAHAKIAVPVLALLIVFPLAAQALDQPFYIGFASRALIFALAATSLNLIVGFGGMVSFGHAAFFGVGAYAVAILMHHGIAPARLSWPIAVASAALCALVVGAISLRTRGVYFIMITLAFAQMLYYVFVSLKAYGGDNGLSLARRSSLGLGLDLKSDITFYYVVLASFVVVMLALHRLVNARFGRALQGIRENETRMEAIGFPVYRCKLIGFTLAGAIAGLAGALLANQNSFVSPNLMHWTQSGSLLVMVILGGVGYVYGGMLGAVVLLLLEETLSGYTVHWQLALGVLLLAVVLRAPNGIASLIRRRSRLG
ncbi:MAG: branched-chain amino acid ABC transporter permease [Usitatibacter sp.]